MKVMLLLAAVLLTVTAYDAAAQGLLGDLFGGDGGNATETDGGLDIHTSFYPYYELTKMVATENDTVLQFVPPGVEAHDWEPSISRVQSLVNADVFVYNGLGVEGYIDRLTGSDDLAHVVFLKATEGLALISTLSVGDALLELLEEYEDGDMDGKQTVDAIAALLNGEEARLVLEGYIDRTSTIHESIQLINGIYGGDYEYTVMPETRATLQEIQNGNITHDEGLEEIHHHLEDAEEEVDEHEGHSHSGHGHEEVDEHEGHGTHGSADPHVWLDPVLAIQQVYNIRDGLTKVNPAYAEAYRDNAEASVQELRELHGEYIKALSDCQQDTIVTAHQAFGYLVERYGIHVRSLSGLSPEEASTSDIIELVDFIRENDIGYILAEDTSDTRAVEIVAEETGAELLTLSPLERTDPDQEMTYFDRMRDNLAILEKALSCS